MTQYKSATQSLDYLNSWLGKDDRQMHNYILKTVDRNFALSFTPMDNGGVLIDTWQGRVPVDAKTFRETYFIFQPVQPDGEPFVFDSKGIKTYIQLGFSEASRQQLLKATNGFIEPYTDCLFVKTHRDTYSRLYPGEYIRYNRYEGCYHIANYAELHKDNFILDEEIYTEEGPFHG